ncbi:MAG TPA: metallophosphoesterase family protein [Chloroflexota bacterium]|nr:metallophosphoesterase family protein [Chloroflexota bacterium]
MLPRDRLRPAGVPLQDVAACLGLISDTHYPERLDRLPDAVFNVFRGVDLILHAGDVGALGVLDELGAVAPVVAVHGNDERLEETQRELPYQQVIAIAGQRIVLSHTHHSDLAREMESRRDDAWGPKLDRRAAFGHRAGAGIVVYGHTHIPTDAFHQDVRLVNPGALASGNFEFRQVPKTVALLYLTKRGEAHVVHVDLAQPDRPFAFAIDWSAGYRAAFRLFQTAILDDEARSVYARLRESARAHGTDTFASARDAMRHACMPCWTGQRERLSPSDILHAIETVPELTGDQRALLRSLTAGSDR